MLTRKQSVWLGVGLLGAFFAISGMVIATKGSGGIPMALNPGNLPAAEAIRTPESEGTPKGDASIVLNDFHRSLVKDGKTLWEVHGKRGRYMPADHAAEVEEPRLTVSRPEGDSLSVSAGRAVLDLDGTDLRSAELYDNVLLRYKDDTTVKTTHATFLQKENKVAIPVYVEIENEMVKVTGNRLTADLNTQEFVIEDRVTSVVKPRKKSEPSKKE